MTEEQQTIRRVEYEIFMPALQEAVKKAQAEGYVLNDVIYGAANAYLNMLVNLLDKENALALLNSQASFLQSKTET